MFIKALKVIISGKYGSVYRFPTDAVYTVTGIRGHESSINNGDFKLLNRAPRAFKVEAPFNI